MSALGKADSSKVVNLTNMSGCFRPEADTDFRYMKQRVFENLPRNVALPNVPMCTPRFRFHLRMEGSIVPGLPIAENHSSALFCGCPSNNVPTDSAGNSKDISIELNLLEAGVRPRITSLLALTTTSARTAVELPVVSFVTQRHRSHVVFESAQPLHCDALQAPKRQVRLLRRSWR